MVTVSLVFQVQRIEPFKKWVIQSKYQVGILSDSLGKFTWKWKDQMFLIFWYQVFSQKEVNIEIIV